MTPRELILATTKRFRAAGIPDPETDSALMLSALIGIPPLRLRMDLENEIDGDILRRMDQMVTRGERREPLQYILGEAPFCGRMFAVKPGSLIPRPETEELCRWAIEEITKISSPVILDLCSGSGCIGLTIQMERPDAKVTMLDISEEAMAVAKENMARFQLSVRMICGDLFSPLDEEKFDLIVSNPPYIPEKDCATLQPEVKYEPMIALNGGADGLFYYRSIAREGKRYLNSGGRLLMEVGDGEAEDVVTLLLENGWERPIIRRDMMHKKRMVSATVFHSREENNKPENRMEKV